MGCIWLIGDGKQVKVWYDNWILGKKLMLTPIECNKPHAQQETTDQLIDENTHNWHMPTMHSFFNPSIVAAILKILLYLVLLQVRIS